MTIFAAACAGPHAAVPCGSASDCTRVAGGTCVPGGSASWCAYPCQCEGGLCYSDLAGDGLAGACVGGTSPDARGTSDGGVDGSPPDAKLGTWSAPSRVIPATTPSEARPVVSPDRKELYFTVQQSGSFLNDVEEITRVSTTDAWSTTESPVAAIDTSNASEYDATISEDGLELYFVRGGDLYFTKRSSTVAPWGSPTPIGYSGESPMLSDGGLTLYFYDTSASCAAGNCRAKLTRSSKSAAWGSRTDVVFPDGGTNVGYQYISVSADGLRLLLSDPLSQATAPVALSFRSSEASAWGPVQPVSALSLYTNIRSARWTWDESEMYLVIGGDLYVSTYQP
jgi:hypothetical protein